MEESSGNDIASARDSAGGERLSVVTIDGPAGAGKTTVARGVAARLGYRYLDTGAMYRALALALDRAGVRPDDDEGLRRVLETIDLRVVFTAEGNELFLGEENVTAAIRAPGVAELASRYSANPLVRERLVELQRRLGREGRLVAEGRDMGTVVFPQARHKFYLDASLEERARRRYRELRARGLPAELPAVMRSMAERDRQDASRAVAPLRKAEDAQEIESTHLTAEQVIERIVTAVRSEER
jgi:cytidylate kinase